MFESFEAAPKRNEGRRWLASAGLSVLLLSGVGAGSLWLLGRAEAKEREVEVAVTFVAKKAEPAPDASPPPVAAEPPPAPPPPPASVVAAAPSVAAPVPAGAVKRRALQAPKAIPTAPPAAVDPIRVAEVGTATAPVEAEPPPPVAAPVVAPAPAPVPAPTVPEPERVTGPIVMEDDFEAPVADAANVLPAYPAEAITLGRQATVVVELRVELDGSVSEVTLVSGEAPFADAALIAVRTWRYRPGRVAGEPVPMARRVKIPFVLRS